MANSDSISLTRIQKLIGKRMSESKRNKPCFYLQLNADVTDLMSRRHRLKKSSGVKITSNAFLIRALALAAHQYPLVLGILQKTPHGPRVTIPNSINVGFAVNAPHALLVPVIPNAHTKTLADIARCEKDLTEKARSKTLTLQQMQGETIALSNLGPYGIDSFLAIVPPPATTILAAGNVVPTVVPQNAKPTVRKMMSLTLSADARIVAGPYAAVFLGCIRDHLQNPDQLI